VSNQRKIILVETNQSLRRYVEQLLRPYGVSVASYGDRWRAFRRIKRRREFDAVLIDKDLAGIGVLRTLFANMLRDLDQRMEFVVLVETPETLDSRPFDDNGYEHILEKSDIPQRLPGMLRQLIGIKRCKGAGRRRGAPARSRAAAAVC
jgi:CheY-like chemotaxis protein